MSKKVSKHNDGRGWFIDIELSDGTHHFSEKAAINLRDELMEIIPPVRQTIDVENIIKRIREEAAIHVVDYHDVIEEEKLEVILKEELRKE